MPSSLPDQVAQNTGQFMGGTAAAHPAGEEEHVLGIGDVRSVVPQVDFDQVAGFLRQFPFHAVPILHFSCGQKNVGNTSPSGTKSLQMFIQTQAGQICSPHRKDQLDLQCDGVGHQARGGLRGQHFGFCPLQQFARQVLQHRARPQLDQRPQAPPVFLGHAGKPVRPRLAGPAGDEVHVLLWQAAMMTGNLADNIEDAGHLAVGPVTAAFDVEPADKRSALDRHDEIPQRTQLLGRHALKNQGGDCLPELVHPGLHRARAGRPAASSAGPCADIVVIDFILVLAGEAVQVPLSVLLERRRPTLEG